MTEFLQYEIKTEREKKNAELWKSNRRTKN
jgi:hypothetical protein